MRFPNIIFLFIFLVLAAAPTGFAEVYGQKDGFFWIDVPQGWGWSETSEGVSIKKENGRDAISIAFQPYEQTAVVVNTETMLWGARNRVVEEVALRGGKSVMKAERKIAGVPAFHLGFLVPSEDGLLQMTAIVFFHKGYAFTITCDARREFQRIEMEKIIDTLTFVEPKKPEAAEEKRDAKAEKKVPKPEGAVPAEETKLPAAQESAFDDDAEDY